MLKNGFWLLISLSLLVSLSCSLSESQYDIETEGVIEELGASYWMYGTHVLKQDDQILYALRSSDIELELYEESTVIILGNLIEGYPLEGGPPYVDVKKIK